MTNLFYLFIFVTLSIVSCLAEQGRNENFNETFLKMAHDNSNEKRIFTIDYQNDSFSMDGKPFRFVSGSLHYFRVPHQYWRDRLRKLRAAGLNTVTTYVEWIHHNPLPDVYKWEGDANLEEFIRLAVEEDLYVILRPGPYICAERDFGGQPWWLLSKYFTEDIEKIIKPRTTDERYMEESRKWLNVLLTKMQPYYYGNGGPIIMVQVENEYSSLGCDDAYKNALIEIFQKYVQDKALLYTTDIWANRLQCGKIEGAYSTVDFGHGVFAPVAWAAQRKIEPRGPLVNSEYYSGWLTHWGEKHANVSTAAVVEALKKILANKSASVNFYMFHGGTNFGYTNGANHEGIIYNPQITSYDYDAPMSEAGDPTEKYFAIREAIGEFFTIPQIPEPTVAQKGDYGQVVIEPALALFDAKDFLKRGEMLSSDKPLSFEQMWQKGGFVLYHTQLQETKSATLHVPKLKDRALVYLDQELIGILDRRSNKYKIELNGTKSQSLEFIVENQGRINYGYITAEYKGLNWPVTWGETELEGWINIGIPLENGLRENTLNTKNVVNRATRGMLINGPVGYETMFDLKIDHEGPIRDTFLDMTGWGKGLAYINGNNLGRYWPSVGPQVTLYVPAVYLNRTENLLEIFELESAPNDLTVSFINHHILDIPTN